VIGVMFEDAVRRRMAMDDDVRVACFFGFVDVLGRRHRKQPQGHGQRAGETPGQVHDSIVCDRRLGRQPHVDCPA